MRFHVKAEIYHGPWFVARKLCDSAIKFYTTKRLSEIYEMVCYVTKIHLLNNLIRKWSNFELFSLKKILTQFKLRVNAPIKMHILSIRWHSHRQIFFSFVPSDNAWSHPRNIQWIPLNQYWWQVWCHLSPTSESKSLTTTFSAESFWTILLSLFHIEFSFDGRFSYLC